MKGKRRRFRFPWRSAASIDTDLETELAFHLEMRTAELVRQGLTAPDARREAEREFGDLELTRSYCRAQDRSAVRAAKRRDRLGELRQHLLYAFRVLRRSPGFTAVTLITLTLAIGTNTAIFSVANAILFAPPPYGDPNRLVALFENNVPDKNVRADMSAADLVDYRREQRTLTGIAILANGGATLRDRTNDPVVVHALYASANMFDILGVRPLRGRTFAPDEDGAAHGKVIILSYDTWQEVFHGQESAIGQTVTLDGEGNHIIGVMPRGFSLGYREQIYVPLDMTPRLTDPNRARKLHWLFGIGRLRTGVGVETARANLNTIARALAAQYPDANTGHYVTVVPMQTALAADSRDTMLVLVGAAALVLLVACANLTNMMLARGTARTQEMIVRTAIGAGRAHLVVQLLSESLVLAVIGGALGIAVALVAVRLIVHAYPRALPLLATPALDWRVLLFSAGVSIATGLAVGILPALRVSRVDGGLTLKSSTRTTAGDRRRDSIRGALVASQTCMAMILVVFAVLLVRSLDAVRHIQLGFDPEDALTATAVAVGPRYQSDDAVNAFFNAVFSRVRDVPGVTAVGAVNSLPPLGSSSCGLVIEGRAEAPDHFTGILCAGARGAYFEAMGTPILSGRTFDQTDRPNTPRAVVINAALARQFFASENPVGKHIRLGPDPKSPWEVIIGVSGDVRQSDLESEPVPMAIENDEQSSWGPMTIVMRVKGDPERFVPFLRGAIRDVDPTVAVTEIRTLEEAVGVRTAGRRLSLTLIGSLGALALILAAVGTYGVLAYAVTTRTREIGIRMALGANRWTVGELVVRQGVVAAVVGIALGLGLAVAAARGFRSMLYGVAALDPLTFGAVTLLLIAITVGVCSVAAARAVRVDPNIAMRAE
jgi:predicted permease